MFPGLTIIPSNTSQMTLADFHLGHIFTMNSRYIGAL